MWKKIPPPPLCYISPNILSYEEELREKFLDNWKILYAVIYPLVKSVTLNIYSRVQFAQGADADADFHIVSRAQICFSVTWDHQLGRKLIYTSIPNDVSTGTEVNIISTHKRSRVISLEGKKRKSKNKHFLGNLGIKKFLFVKPESVTFKWKLLSGPFLWHCMLCSDGYIMFFVWPFHWRMLCRTIFILYYVASPFKSA